MAAAAARAGNHSPVGAGGVGLASWQRGSGGKADNRSGVAGMSSVRRVYIYICSGWPLPGMGRWTGQRIGVKIYTDMGSGSWVGYICTFIHQHIGGYVYRTGTVWTKSPGITEVSHPSESLSSGVYETAFETSIAGGGRAGGRFLVAVVRPSGEAQSRVSFASWRQRSEGGGLDETTGDRAGRLPI